MEIQMNAQQRETTQRQRRLKVFIPRVGYYITCSILAIIFLFPLAWMFLSTFKTSAEGAQVPPTYWPQHFSLESYLSLFTVGAGALQYLGNTIFVTALTIILTIVLSVFAAYGFARFPFPGKNIAFVLILTGLMVPFTSIMTPLFVLLHYLGLQNSLFGLALVYTTFQLPFSIFMMRNSFESVPRELQEAALIDGCTPITMLYRVMLPVAYPGVVTVGLFTFFAAWNEFFAALIFLSDSDKYTFPIYLVSAQQGQYGTINWNSLQAGVVISALPCIIVFLILQRFYIKGLMSGAVKA